MKWETITFEDKIHSTHDSGRVKPSAVASLGIDGEGGVFAAGVRVMVVVTLPGVVVVVEDKMAGEEEDIGAYLTALAHPLTVQADSEVGSRWQDRGVELVWVGDDRADDAGVVVMLKTKTEICK